jgi:hypothetical protein
LLLSLCHTEGNIQSLNQLVFDHHFLSGETDAVNDTNASAIDSEQQEESEHVPDSDDVSSPSLGASNLILVTRPTLRSDLCVKRLFIYHLGGECQ